MISLVDTAGAYPGFGAESAARRKPSARSTDACWRSGAPNVAVVIGEGGSGGAIAIARRQQGADAGARGL